MFIGISAIRGHQAPGQRRSLSLFAVTYRGFGFLRVVAAILLFGRLWTRFCFLAGRGHDFAIERG